MTQSSPASRELMFDLSETICQITGASSCSLGSVIQSLWSGYGVIQRVQLRLPEFPTAIVKHIDLTQARENRRGWSGDVSHQRKVLSYQIEKHFYESYASQHTLDPATSESLRWRIPRLLGSCKKAEEAGYLLVLEDLDAAGYGARKNRVTQANLNACLHWLANFHAHFMGSPATGLWPVGTYWHLETRQEELKVMEDNALKRLAPAIDQRLSNARFQTLVHGDAKLANFCFGGSTTVAAVDFQYVGGGCGMKDVAYLVSSCLDGSESEAQQNELLDIYFHQLKTALGSVQPQVNATELESEWRELYPFAWADFCRFLAGWSPGHWKMNEYNDRITKGVLAQLGNSI